MGQPHLGKNGTAMSSLLHHNGLYMDILVSTLSDLKKKKNVCSFRACSAQLHSVCGASYYCTTTGTTK